MGSILGKTTQTQAPTPENVEYLPPRERPIEEFINRRCQLLRRMQYSEAIIERFRKSGAMKWPKPTFIVGGPREETVRYRMPDF